MSYRMSHREFAPKRPRAVKASPEGKISASRLRGATEGECEYLGFRAFHPNILTLQRRPPRGRYLQADCAERLKGNANT